MSNASTNPPPVEPSHGGTGRKLSDTIPMEAVQRIAKLPVVESSLNIATDMYSRMKESSSMMNWTLSTAESTVNKAVEHAIPVAEKMEKHLKRMDSLLCSSLDYVEAKVPAVKLPPAEILESTSKLVESKLQPALDRASELKQMGAEKVRTLARDSATPTQLVTNCTKIAASGVEAAHRYMNSASTHLANGEVPIANLIACLSEIMQCPEFEIQFFVVVTTMSQDALGTTNGVHSPSMGAVEAGPGSSAKDNQHSRHPIYAPKQQSNGAIPLPPSSPANPSLGSESGGHAKFQYN